MIPDRLYKKRCFFVGRSKCLANGNYTLCEMMRPNGKGLFYVPDDRPIYDEQECRFFLRDIIWRGYRHQASWLFHDGEK